MILSVSPRRRMLCVLALGALGGGCGDTARLPPAASEGPYPQLPQPVEQLIPTVHIAPAKGWPDGQTPTPASGLRVGAFATGLNHPRWLLVLPNGDVLVAETNAPERPEDGKGIKAQVRKRLMKDAGAAVPSANRIVLLRDADGDGVAEQRVPFIEGLKSPFGMALVGSSFYVANTDAVLHFPYATGATRISAAGQPVVDLPGGPLNHHWTKNILPSPDGRKLYATVGSNSNVGENGLDKEEGRAAIWEIDLQRRSKRLFASGLRNPNGMAWEPVSGTLWTVVNERDELGSDLVPDYLTSVSDGGFYGWPYSYYGRHVDDRVAPRPELVATAKVPDYALGNHVAPLGLASLKGSRLPSAKVPDYALGNHVAPLGLASLKGSRLPAPFVDGMVIGEHGSWNRKPHSGYKVVFIPFANGRPQGKPIDVLTGFISPDGDAWGRPVGVVVDRQGALLVADDVGNTVWRVSAR